MNKKTVSGVFMATGLVLILSSLALLIYNNSESNQAKESSAEIMVSLHEAIEADTNTTITEDPFDTEMKTQTINGYDYIGYLYIPVLETELPVMSDWNYEKLTISPCRYYGSTKTDNLVIAAHNYKYHFGYLGHLQTDDIIIFTDIDDNKLTYRVTSVELLEPTDTKLVKDSGDDLILYTCNYGGSKRITVRCSYLTDTPQ